MEPIIVRHIAGPVVENLLAIPRPLETDGTNPPTRCAGAGRRATTQIDASTYSASKRTSVAGCRCGDFHLRKGSLENRI